MRLLMIINLVFALDVMVTKVKGNLVYACMHHNLDTIFIGTYTVNQLGEFAHCNIIWQEVLHKGRYKRLKGKLTSKVLGKHINLHMSIGINAPTKVKPVAAINIQSNKAAKNTVESDLKDLQNIYTNIKQLNTKDNVLSDLSSQIKDKGLFDFKSKATEQSEKQNSPKIMANPKLSKQEPVSHAKDIELLKEKALKQRNKALLTSVEIQEGIEIPEEVEIPKSKDIPASSANQKSIEIQESIDVQKSVFLVQECINGDCKILHSYPLVKDYNCSNCKNYFDEEKNEFAFAYRLYYQENGVKIYPNEEIYFEDPIHVETILSAAQHGIGGSHEFITPNFDLIHEEKIVASQVTKSKYQNIPITLKPCTLQHNWEENFSILPFAAIFTLDDQEHVLVPCGYTQKRFEHFFDDTNCQWQVDDEADTATKYQSRYINIDTEKQYITHCTKFKLSEPITYDYRICEPLWEHYYGEGKSNFYAKGILSSTDEEVLPCKLTDKYLRHAYRLIDYEYDDEKKLSIPVIQVFINYEGEEILLDVTTTHPSYLPIEYEKDGYEIIHENVQFSECSCIKIGTKKPKFKRQDGSIYIEDTVIPYKDEQHDLCTYEYEEKTEYVFSEAFSKGKWQGIAPKDVIQDPDFSLKQFGCSRQYYANKKRKITTLADGTKRIGEWEIVGEPFIHDE